jgi:hypothetical protein
VPARSDRGRTAARDSESDGESPRSSSEERAFPGVSSLVGDASEVEPRSVRTMATAAEDCENASVPEFDDIGPNRPS